MASNNSTNMACFEVYDTPGYQAVIGLRVISAIISIFCCSVMLFLMVLFKKYLFFTQRLIMYLAIAALAYSIVAALNVEGYVAYRSPSAQKYCVFAGLIEQVGSWWVVLATTCIMVDLFIKVIFQRRTERLEWVYVVVTFATPLVTAWIPFINNAYGASGAWCWIRSNDYDDCANFPFGTWLRYTLYYVPLYVLLIILIILLVIVLTVLKRRQKQWIGNYDPNAQRLQKRMQSEIRPLLAYPIIFIIVNIPPFANRITNTVRPEDPELVLWIISGIVFPLQGTLVMLAFALDPETRKLLTVAQFVAACRRLFLGEGGVAEYNTGLRGRSDSLTEYPTADLSLSTKEPEDTENP